MFFEPKPEFSAIVKGGYNCRAFGSVRNIGGQEQPPSYTPPLVKGILGATMKRVEEEYEAFASTKGRMVLAMSEIHYAPADEETSDGWYMTVIYQERIQYDDPGAD